MCPYSYSLLFCIAHGGFLILISYLGNLISYLGNFILILFIII